MMKSADECNNRNDARLYTLKNYTRSNDQCCGWDCNGIQLSDEFFVD